MIPDVGAPTRIRNPGRRGVSADSYLFPIRMPLEIALRGDRAYRTLRYEYDRLEAIASRSGLMSGARRSSLTAQIQRAGTACAEYLLRHLPEPEPEIPTILTRELGPDGTLESEVETPVAPEAT